MSRHQSKFELLTDEQKQLAVSLINSQRSQATPEATLKTLTYFKPAYVGKLARAHADAAKEHVTRKAARKIAQKLLN
jgi:hypothetical protein